MQNRIYNISFIAFFVLIFLISLGEGTFGHILSIVDLILIGFGLHQAGVKIFGLSIDEWITVDLGFLKGSVYLTIVGIYSAVLTLLNLLSSGLIHFVIGILGVFVASLVIIAAKSAYEAENASLEKTQ